MLDTRQYIVADDFDERSPLLYLKLQIEIVQWDIAMKTQTQFKGFLLNPVPHKDYAKVHMLSKVIRT